MKRSALRSLHIRALARLVAGLAALVARRVALGLRAVRALCSSSGGVRSSARTRRQTLAGSRRGSRCMGGRSVSSIERGVHTESASAACATALSATPPPKAAKSHQVARLAAVEAFAVQGALLPRHRALGRDVADLRGKRAHGLTVGRHRDGLNERARRPARSCSTSCGGRGRASGRWRGLPFHRRGCHRPAWATAGSRA